MRNSRATWLLKLAAATAITIISQQAFAAQSAEPVDINSFSGAFLAANVAEADNDLDGAIAYYKRALAFDPENSALQQSLMLALLSQGPVRRGASLCRHAEGCRRHRALLAPWRWLSRASAKRIGRRPRLI